jgi:hypothetical protein
MDPRAPLFAVPALLLIIGSAPPAAAKTVEEAGVLVCVNDKWDETEPEKGHKLVDYAGRCVSVPDDPAAPKVSEDCKGRYEYMPDGSWKASGTCTKTIKGEGTKSATWEEGSHLKESVYTYTGGTGKYQGVKGGGTYLYENLTDALAGGRFKGKFDLP